MFRQTDAKLVLVALSVKRLLRRNRKTINETRSVTATGYLFPGLLTRGLATLWLINMLGLAKSEILIHRLLSGQVPKPETNSKYKVFKVKNIVEGWIFDND
ncbi:MAG: hypothetical protein ACETWQ_09240 [Phycisphaerae bacterium]